MTKSIEKYSNNYTIQHMHHQHIFYGGFNEINLLLSMLLLIFLINLAKVGIFHGGFNEINLLLWMLLLIFLINLAKVGKVWLEVNLLR